MRNRDINDNQFVYDCKQFLKSKMSIRQFVKCCSTGYSRSGFHSQIHERLPYLNKRLYNDICAKMKYNFKNRHYFSKKEKEVV